MGYTCRHEAVGHVSPMEEIVRFVALTQTDWFMVADLCEQCGIGRTTGNVCDVLVKKECTPKSRCAELRELVSPNPKSDPGLTPRRTGAGRSTVKQLSTSLSSPAPAPETLIPAWWEGIRAFFAFLVTAVLLVVLALTDDE